MEGQWRSSMALYWQPPDLLRSLPLLQKWHQCIHFALLLVTYSANIRAEHQLPVPNIAGRIIMRLLLKHFQVLLWVLEEASFYVVSAED